MLARGLLIQKRQALGRRVNTIDAHTVLDGKRWRLGQPERCDGDIMPTAHQVVTQIIDITLFTADDWMIELRQHQDAHRPTVPQSSHEQRERRIQAAAPRGESPLLEDTGDSAYGQP